MTPHLAFKRHDQSRQETHGSAKGDGIRNPFLIEALGSLPMRRDGVFSLSALCGSCGEHPKNTENPGCLVYLGLKVKGVVVIPCYTYLLTTYPKIRCVLLAMQCDGTPFSKSTLLGKPGMPEEVPGSPWRYDRRRNLRSTHIGEMEKHDIFPNLYL